MFTMWLFAKKDFFSLFNSRNGEMGKTIILNVHSFVTNQMCFHEEKGVRKKTTGLQLEAKECSERKPQQRESHESNGRVTDTHRTPWPTAEACLKHCFSEEHTLTHCCHFIKFMEVVLCKNKNYHKVICCIIIIHKCAKCRQMCWPFKVERLTETQPDSVL